MHQGPSESRSLLLAAGQLVRITVAEPIDVNEP